MRSDRKRIKFRELVLKSGIKMLLGRDAETNDELMKMYKGKENIILHTKYPGSPFCVIDNLYPNEREIYLAGVVVAKYSKFWKKYKQDVEIDVFNGTAVSKPKNSKKGLWNVKNTRTIKIKKEDILRFENEGLFE
ncbi:MAG: NFACT RNA binding domain-containing protein [Candidatus Pacearchaeota archaeon]